MRTFTRTAGLCLISSLLLFTGLGLGLSLITKPVVAADPEEKASQDQSPEENSRGASRRSFGLLVGVTRYPSLSKNYQLEGPANDVLMMSDLLHESYGFATKDIVILSEKAGESDPAKLPTRENIKRECERIAREARSGDRVIVAMSGHGSQQPEHPDFPERDGMDKTFLPRDVGKWDDGAATTPNTIPGRVLGDWLRPIPKKGASLWIVMDACHSGAMVRGVSEKARQIDATRELDVPQAAFQKAREQAEARAHNDLEKSRGDGGPREVPMRLGHEDGVAIIYACQSSEVTVEMALPPQTADAKPHGLLTYTINQVLRSSKTQMTYRELVQAVQSRYDAMGRRFPTPLVEGKARNHVVLGEDKPARSPIMVSKKGNGLQINAGKLHGIRAGSFLAVKSNEGKLVGHVQVKGALSATTAEVESCAYEGQPVAKKESLAGGRAEVVRVDFGDLKMRVALSPNDSAGKPLSAAQRKPVQDALQKLAKASDTPIVLVEEIPDADWVIQLDAGNVVLIRTSELVSEQLPLFLTKNDTSERLLPVLKKELGGVVRSQMLVKLANDLAAPTGSADEGRPRLKMTVRVKRKDEEDWKVLDDPLMRLHAGDEVQFELANGSKIPIDATVLYVNSQFGIDVLYPIDGEINRIKPDDKPIKIPNIEVNSDTTGREQIILIAVRADGQPVDFSVFAQPTLNAVKLETNKESTRGELSRAVGSPLGQLLSSALYSDGKGQLTRSLSRKQIDNYSMEALPVQVEVGP